MKVILDASLLHMNALSGFLYNAKHDEVLKIWDSVYEIPYDGYGNLLCQFNAVEMFSGFKDDFAEAFANLVGVSMRKCEYALLQVTPESEVERLWLREMFDNWIPDSPYTEKQKEHILGML